jgi:hypothetical protein
MIAQVRTSRNTDTVAPAWSAGQHGDGLRQVYGLTGREGIRGLSPSSGSAPPAHVRLVRHQQCTVRGCPGQCPAGRPAGRAKPDRQDRADRAGPGGGLCDGDPG